MKTVHLTIDVSGVPSEFRLLKAGVNAYKGGELLFDEQAAASVMSRYQSRGIQLMADYEHQSLRDDLTGPVPAAAKRWTPEVRGGELIAADITWTARAKQMLADGEYRYFSIACAVEPKTNRVVEIINFALTNLPAADRIEPLVAASAIHTAKESNMKNVIVALGLSASAEEADALAAVSSLRDFERNVIALSGQQSRAEALGALNALSLKASRADVAEAELVALKQAGVKSKIEQLIDGAILDGRVEPAQREKMVALADKGGVEGLEMCLSMLKPSKAPAVQPVIEASAAPVVAGVDPEIAKILKATGLSSEDFAKARTKYRAVIHQTQDKE